MPFSPPDTCHICHFILAVMMNESRILQRKSDLESILAASGRICNILCKNNSNDDGQISRKILSTVETSLHLPSSRITEFKRHLPTCLSINASEKVERVFKLNEEKIFTAYKRSWTCLTEHLSQKDIDEKVDYKQIAHTFEKECYCCIEELFQTLRGLVNQSMHFNEQQLRRYYVTKLDSNSTVHGTEASRTHSKLAVSILEKAYSHTKNITRAEKHRLAEMTKLEPKQITIWVSFQMTNIYAKN